LHDFLNEAGYKVVRWRETPQKLLTGPGKLVKTFAVVGDLKVRFTDAEQNALTNWVAAGGHLVVIDRNPEQDASTAKSGAWKITIKRLDFPSLEVNPADSKQMTDMVVALQPVQPTLLTRKVESVLPSRFASRINIEPAPSYNQHTDEPTDSDEETPPTAQPTSTSVAPVVHMLDDKGALLIDYAYGSGSVAILTDPYIVSNGGIRLNDNLQLAVNLLTAGGGSPRQGTHAKQLCGLLCRDARAPACSASRSARAVGALDERPALRAAAAIEASRSPFESGVCRVDG
jgi:hypothetical protein